MEEKKIRVYHTHIEVSPYEFGECEKLERMQSIWIDAEYRYEPIGYYIENTILYLPRGVSITLLENLFDTQAMVDTRCSEFDTVSNVKMTVGPRDDIQKRALDFLISEGEFKHTLKYSQQALTLETGKGKTYVTVNAIVSLKKKAIIITHQDKIKKQWIDTFLEKTTVKESKLIDIHGSDTIENIIKGKKGYIGDYYFINHQTISSYAKKVGWIGVRDFFDKLKVGIKVVDEAHLSFANVLKIDFFSNVWKTYYLTANFGRSDVAEQKLFQKSFSSAVQHDGKTENDRKHIIYVPVIYRSNPSYNDILSASNMYGFSVLGFAKYALENDPDKTMIRVFFNVFDVANRLEGRILITVPKIDQVEMMREWIKKEYPDLNKTISTIHSNNTKDQNEKAKEADIICSTIKSSGTGVDINGLRCIINMEPFSSQIVANQLAGRLREYAPDKDTFFFDLVDIAFSTCDNQYNKRMRYLKKKCKEIRIMKL